MSSQSLVFLAELIEAGRLSWPPDEGQVRALGVNADHEECWHLLGGAAEAGGSAVLASWLLRRIAAERADRDAVAAAVELVVSGPRFQPGLRETADAFREVIRRAMHTVLIAGFALHNGQTVLAQLAERMAEKPSLDVILCLDISRPPGDTSDPQAIISRFAQRFREKEWPTARFPRLFYDPRSLSQSQHDRSVLHAKLAIADGRCALVGSANLTEAAFARNIEVGLFLSLPSLVAGLHAHLLSLIQEKVLVRVPL